MWTHVHQKRHVHNCFVTIKTRNNPNFANSRVNGIFGILVPWNTTEQGLQPGTINIWGWKSFCWELGGRCLLCIIGCIAASVASTRQTPVVATLTLWQPKMSPALPPGGAKSLLVEKLYTVMETNVCCHLRQPGWTSQHNVEQKQQMLKELYSETDRTVWDVWRENTLREKGRGVDWGTQRAPGKLFMFYYVTWLVVPWVGHLVIICQVYDLCIFLYGCYTKMFLNMFILLWQ